MKVVFSKYQGTGNDFILLDNLNGLYNELSIENICFLCDRKFGIGADGLIKINKMKGYSFEVEYFNSDGSKSFCGNGARCAVHFAGSLGIPTEEVRFWAIDGEHLAFCNKDEVRLKMIDVERILKVGEDFEVYTGSQHYIHFTNDLSTENTVRFGKEIRYSEAYEKNGINVNLMEKISFNQFRVSTYERGVEDETLSCGTGVTACAIVADFLSEEPLHEVSIDVKGGKLSVSLERDGDTYRNIYLIGPASFVFNGEINL